MAFLGKVFNKKKGTEDADEQDESQDWSFDFELDGDKEEKPAASRFSVNKVRAADDPDEADEESGGETLEDAPEDSDEAAGDNEGKAEAPSPADALMSIFEEEHVANQWIEALAASVEEVDAEELAEELRAFVDDLQRY